MSFMTIVRWGQSPWPAHLRSAERIALEEEEHSMGLGVGSTILIDSNVFQLIALGYRRG